MWGGGPGRRARGGELGGALKKPNNWLVTRGGWGGVGQGGGQRGEGVGALLKNP